MSSGVRGLHERSVEFCLRLPLPSSLWCVVSCKRAATSLVPRVSLSSSVSFFVCLCLRHSCVTSAVKELPLRSSPERVRPRLSPSSPVSVFVCLRRSARWLVQRVSAVCPVFYIEVLETTVACAFCVCAVLRRERGKLLKRPLLCCDVFP